MHTACMVCLILQPEGIPLFNFVDSRSVESWESYLLNMSKYGTWGTHLELQALSNMLSVTFCLVTNSSVDSNVNITYCNAAKFNSSRVRYNHKHTNTDSQYTKKYGNI